MSEEVDLIRSFVLRQKRDRMITLLASRKGRSKVTSSLAHFSDLDPRWVLPIAPAQHNAPDIERLLRQRGAGETCHVVSENGSLDGRRFRLSDALHMVVGKGMGTLISCIPGRLAFFEGEDPSDRCLLVRLGTIQD